MNQNKTSFITYIDKIEKAYLKAVKTIYRPHFERRGPERKDIFKVLKNNINNTSFVLSNNLLNRAKQIADLINLKKRYPNHYILEILFKLDDLLAFIVNGYYSTDLLSYSERLSEFFDLVVTFNEVVKGQVHDYLHWDGSKVWDYIETKGDWYSITRETFRDIYFFDEIGDFQTFQSKHYRESYFTIRIVHNKLQILFRKEHSEEPKAQLAGAVAISKELNLKEPLNFYELADNLNDRKYLFKLNFKKIFQDKIEQQEWYEDYLSKYYFSFEVADFPDSLDAMGKLKSLEQVKAELEQFFSKNSNDEKMIREEIFKRIDENSGVDYILNKGHLKHLTNQELLQLLTPFTRLLKTYFGTPKYHSYRDELLRGYLGLWRGEKNVEKHGLRFDGYYHNFYYYTVRRNEEIKIHTDLKFYDDGAVKFGKGPQGFDKAQGRYLYSSNKIYFFLSNQKGGSPAFSIIICEGIVNKDEIDISTLSDNTLIYLSNGKYKFTLN
jgi:hypothetical protein